MRKLGRPLRWGLIGGGATSRIGPTHRYAARLDGKYALVAGALDVDAPRGRAFARDLFIQPERAYDSYEDLIAAERGRADPVDVVSVVTPNDSHFPISKALIEAGFAVICEKPLANTIEHARTLVEQVERRRGLLAVNYGYSGYPMVRQARAMITAGAIGKVQLVQAEFALGSVGSMSEDGTANWRTKPDIAGPSAVLGMIGTHAAHLASYVSGLKLLEVSADTQTFVPGRQLEDNAQILCRYENGARGSMWISYVAAGAWHGLRLRIFGETGGIEWVQEQPNELLVHRLGKERQILTRNGIGTPSEVSSASRVAPAHPEGFIEAVGNVYSDFADAVAAKLTGTPATYPYPDAMDGLLGVNFIDAVLESSRANGRWISAEPSV
ncbi:gfo/Idh/MocA family oxidoreductase [Pelagibacterium lacus]|uniref:Gfo/Idh/MocA family oxidoreductase n=2 Tax=Pelagibacterium lacus TaxID=2282655 RepID=A0A369VZR2_9HYPH|nr:gfo/Idh/MocA family oxidoreductase [Pelagibacterium lacus]